MIKRTYSKRALESSSRGAITSNKRRRVEYTSSSTQIRLSSSSPLRTPVLFSDENAPASTSPSSPLYTSMRPKKRQLEYANDDVISSSPPKRLPLQLSATNPMARSKAKPKQKLTQMTLDLGQKTQIRCQTCGMEYRPSSKEDDKLHKKFHSQNVDGIPLNLNLVLQLRAAQGMEGVITEDAVLGLDLAVMKLAKVKNALAPILEVVETELGGVGIPQERLWEQIDVRAKEGEVKKAVVDRYKAFLYIRGNKVLGVCLAERIFEAYEVLPPPEEARDSAITTSEQAQPAQMGISRIWVSKCARGEGIAAKLLDEACANFMYRITVSRDRVAFSQPTESGAKLAKRWFGKNSGWLVYSGCSEDHPVLKRLG